MEEFNQWIGKKYRLLLFFWYNCPILKFEEMKYEKYSTF